MLKYINSQFHLLLMVSVLTLALFPTTCSALSIANSPCDVGNGFFLFQPSYNDEGWLIYFENETQKNICYRVDREDGFVSSTTPEYDFDKTWLYIKTDIHEPKHVEPPQRDRTQRLVYFLFNKETREMIGPLTPNEFYNHPAAAKKSFDWKRGDYKDSSGVKWIILAGFFTLCSPILLAILLGILGKWGYELHVHLHK